MEIAEENRTEISVSGVKTISGFYAEDEAYSVETQIGTSAWKNTEIISGRYMTEANARAAAGQIMADGSYSYYGWSLTSAVGVGIYPLGTYVDYGGRYLPALSQKWSFGAQITAQLGADKPDTSFSEYSSLYSRQIDGKVQYGRLFGCGVIDRNGFNLLSKAGAVINSG